MITLMLSDKDVASLALIYHATNDAISSGNNDWCKALVSTSLTVAAVERIVANH